MELDIPSIRLIGHDPEYVTFEDYEDDVEKDDGNEEIKQPDGPILVDDNLVDPGYFVDPVERKVTIIYCDETEKEPADEDIDTYLIYAGKGALLSVELV